MARLIPLNLILILWGTALFGQPPEGYYDAANGKSGEELKGILHDIIDGHTALSYSALWDGLIDTDEDPDDPDRFILLYTQRSLLKTEEYPLWNREHVWAKSHGGFDNDPPAGTDMHHIKPSDESVNSDRGNLDFDYCSETGTQHNEATSCYYTSSAWEPGDNVKGDVARMMFYMAVRYEGDAGAEPDLELQEDIPSSGPFFGKLSTLLDWHQLDPPGTFEERRNNRIYEAYQGNRNPFIDKPEFADYIWGGVIPSSVSSASELIMPYEIWPNPATNEVYISTSSKEIRSLTLYDLNGRVIYKSAQNGPGIKFMSVDLSDIPSGVWFIRISDKSGTRYFHKLIIRENFSIPAK